MTRTFRYAYVLAKIYGVLARSFVGNNYQEILRLRKLGELYDRLFPGERREVPEHQLASELEERIVSAGIRSLTSILDLLGQPVEILVHILRKFEYEGVKSVIRGIAHGRPEEAQVWDLGRYSGVDLAGSKDYQRTIASSEFSWVLPLLENTSLVKIENRLDRDYYARMMALANKLPARDRSGVKRLVSLEISLANVVWALRLRFFFGMDAAGAQDLLIPGLIDTQRKAIDQVFTIPSDSLEDWRKWKFGWLLEEQLNESFQSPDPVRAEHQAVRRLYARAHQLFHQDPFTLTPLVAFFKLKEYESELLQTAVEALRLAVPEQDVLALIGAG